jgi:hypothetical protein
MSADRKRWIDTAAIVGSLQPAPAMAMSTAKARSPRRDANGVGSSMSSPVRIMCRMRSETGSASMFTCGS